jgi:hypothetical protein
MRSIWAFGLIFGVGLGLLAQPAQARNTVANYPIEAIRAQPEYAAQIGDFRFEFGNEVKGTKLGTSNSLQATNGVNKSDERACAWAALGALIKMKADAIARGGTSVQGIVSATTGTDFSSTTQYQCISGFTNSRVRFSGQVVK